MPDKKDNKAFEFMIAEADKTNVDLFAEESKGYETKDIHTALMAAGFAPGIGNIADMADAMLYAMEGEFGEAAISAAAMIPIAGQMVSTKRALKAAEAAGEKFVTVYRGVEKWIPGKMTSNGKFVGGGRYPDFPLDPRRLEEPKWKKGNKGLWATTDPATADKYAQSSGPVLEFRIPESFVEKHGVFDAKWGESAYIFKGGVPKEYLVKVNKGFDKKVVDVPYGDRSVKRVNTKDSYSPDMESILNDMQKNIKRPKYAKPIGERLSNSKISRWSQLVKEKNFTEAAKLEKELKEMGVF
jgi:hypothetical protein